MKIKSILFLNGVISISVFFFILGASYFSTFRELLPTIASMETHGHVIDVAGRQRMLTQKMSKEASLLAAGNENAQSLLSDTAKEFDEALGNLAQGNSRDGIPIPPTSKAKASVREVQNIWETFHNNIKTLLNDPSDEVALEYIIANNAELLESSNQFVLDWKEYSDHSSSELVTHSKKSFFVQLGLFLISISSMIYLNFLLFRRVTRPVARTVKVVKQMAGGDLSGSVLVKRNDEFGEVGNALNETNAALKSLVLKIENDSTSISDISSTLYDLVTQMQSAFDEMTKKASDMSGAGGVLNQNMNSMAAASEQFTSTVGTIALSMDQLNGSVNEIARNCVTEAQIAQEAHKRVQGTSEMMNELGSAASEIGTIVDVISSIADQTNLLALNATIEAASAGEAGKGFAVVANEVKELAKQSADAAAKISAQIEGIQNKTHKSVEEIRQVSETIEQVNEIATTISGAVEEQSATVSEVANSIQAFDESSRNLTSNIQESAMQTESISNSVDEINHALLGARSGNEENSSIAQKLISVSQDMSQSIGHFKV